MGRLSHTGVTMTRTANRPSTEGAVMRRRPRTPAATWTRTDRGPDRRTGSMRVPASRRLRHRSTRSRRLPRRPGPAIPETSVRFSPRMPPHWARARRRTAGRGRGRRPAPVSPSSYESWGPEDRDAGGLPRHRNGRDAGAGREIDDIHRAGVRTDAFLRDERPAAVGGVGDAVGQ